MASALQSDKNNVTPKETGLRYREITAQSIQRMQILRRGIFMPAFDRILQLARMEEMDCEFVEVTAHEGARPTHAVWQGRVYHRGGAVVQDGERYEDFEAATGYGTGPGLCGWNCRHNFYPFYPGISVRNYTDERLAELDARNIPYGGGLYTRYEITQMQRALERRVRRYKRRYLAETAAGVDRAGTAVLPPCSTPQHSRSTKQKHPPGYGGCFCFGGADGKSNPCPKRKRLHISRAQCIY